MKILYYLPALYAAGGLERIITFKANRLSEDFGHEVYILTSEQVGRKVNFELSPNVKHIDIDVPFDWPFEQSGISKFLKYPSQYKLFKQRFTNVLMEVRPDITISTLRRELNFIHSIPDGSVKIGEFHATRYAYGIGYNNFGNPFLYLMHKHWERRFLNNARKFRKLILLTCDEDLYWPELNNLVVIPNPITIHTERQSDCTARQVIAVGRFEHSKGFDLLIEAWSLVHRRHPEWILRIFGDGILRNAYETQIENLGLEDNCLLEQTVDNIVDKYCECSMLALPSRYESFGMVITESMACGIPTVAFSCPCGPRNIITDGKDGILVENGNIAALAENLCYLMECDGVRQEMGRQARKSAERYQPQQIIKQWDELFRKLLS